MKLFSRIALAGLIPLGGASLKATSCHAAMGDEPSEFRHVGVTGHRGNASVRPENTLAGFESAIALGVDWFEMDLHRTSDGHLVVIHDTTTKRVGDTNLTVAASTLEQLRTVDVAYAFRKARRLSYDECPVQRIPTLTDVLSMATNQRATRVSIHPKTNLVDEAIDLIESLNASAWVGFNDGTLTRIQRVKERAPEIPVFWDVGATFNPATTVQMARQYGFEAVVIEYRGASTAKVEQIRAAGIEVGVWVVNSPSSISNFLQMGIERIYTDAPATVLAIQTADADENGLPDIWERRYFGSLSGVQGLTDDDHDGMSNRHEYLAGTDPKRRESCLTLTAVPVTNSPSNVALRWPSVTGKTYRIATSSNLSSPDPWSRTAFVYKATPPWNTLLIPPPASPCFLRVEVKVN